MDVWGVALVPHRVVTSLVQCDTVITEHSAMDSDTDSEHDRRAYGQYTSLAVDGDENVDEEAAAYLRAVR